MNRAPVVLAITGASGAPYGVRLLAALARNAVPTWLMISSHGWRLLGEECDIATEDALRTATGGNWSSVTTIGVSAMGSLKVVAEGVDRGHLVGKLDWVTKQWLLDTFVREEQIGWDDPWLASLDLEYHNVSPDRGLHRALEAEGKIWRLTTEKDVEEAMSAGPSDTRGGLRGLCVRRFGDRISQMQWERIRFSGGWRPLTLEMGDLFDPLEVRQCASVFERAASPAEALTAWNTRKDLST